MSTATRCVCMTIVAVVLLNVYAARLGADTFTHKETDETFTGIIGDAMIGDKTLVIRSNGKRIYINLDDYDIVQDEHAPPEQLTQPPTDTQKSKSRSRKSSERAIVYVIPITGQIGGIVEQPFLRWTINVDRGMDKSVEEAIRRAREARADVILIDVNTYGGVADTANEIARLIVDIDDMQTVAFVRQKAISAGVPITASCRAIFFERGASIGGAAPISSGIITPEHQEKMVSIYAALDRSIVERAGHSPLLIAAMTDQKISLFFVKLDDGTERIVEADDADAVRALVAPLKAVTLEQITKEGSLLTLTASEALRYGLSSGTVNDLDELLAAMEIENPRVINDGLPCWPCRGTGLMQCPLCGGRGLIEKPFVCPTCGGAGGKYVTKETGGKITSEFEPCKTCGGTGEITKLVGCPICNPNAELTPLNDPLQERMRLRREQERAKRVGKVPCPFCDGKGAVK